MPVGGTVYFLDNSFISNHAKAGDLKEILKNMADSGWDLRTTNIVEAEIARAPYIDDIYRAAKISLTSNMIARRLLCRGCRALCLHRLSAIARR